MPLTREEMSSLSLEEWGRLPEVDILSREIDLGMSRKRRPPHGAFIAGPFPFLQFCIAARLPGKALAVWELVHHQVRMTQRGAVTLPGGLLATAGIDRNAKARALSNLQRVGLIRLQRGTGQSPKVSLVTLPEDNR